MLRALKGAIHINRSVKVEPSEAKMNLPHFGKNQVVEAMRSKVSKDVKMKSELKQALFKDNNSQPKHQ